MVPSIRLRPVEEVELDSLLRFRWDAEVTGEFQWFGYRMNSARSLKTRWVEDGLVSDTASSFLTVALEDGNAAGWVTWTPIGNFATTEIGIVLFPAHRGRELVGRLSNFSSTICSPQPLFIESKQRQRLAMSLSSERSSPWGSFAKGFNAAFISGRESGGTV
jgi:hypothetical protein